MRFDEPKKGLRYFRRGFEIKNIVLLAVNGLDVEALVYCCAVFLFFFACRCWLRQTSLGMILGM